MEIQPDQPGGQHRTDELIQLVYGQLRAVAQEWMQREAMGHTLQATGLVNEAFIRLARERSSGWQSQAQFFAAAAEAMRRILIEHARSKARLKRGGGKRGCSLDIDGVLDLANEHPPEAIEELDSAFSALEAESTDLAQVVRLRFFAGLSVERTAQALGVSERTVKRDWAYARAWLRDHLIQRRDDASSTGHFKG